MKFDFPKIVRTFNCTEYAPEIDATFSVWVNPPQKLLNDLAEAFKAYIDSKGQESMDPFLTLLSELLSQGNDKWSLEDLQHLLKGSGDTDPGFWLWFQNRVLKEINDHRLQRKNS